MQHFLWSSFKCRAVGFLLLFSDSQSVLYLFESKNTFEISHYLAEVKRSVSHAHSTSLMYYGTVNSLARMEVYVWRMRAKPNGHIHQRWRRFTYSPLCTFSLFSIMKYSFPALALTTLLHSQDWVNCIHNSKHKIFLVSCTFVLFCFHLTQQISISIQLYH